MSNPADDPTNDDNIPTSIKWRGSTYNLEEVVEQEVRWFNPVSRHHGVCSRYYWYRNSPYGDKYGAVF